MASFRSLVKRRMRTKISCVPAPWWRRACWLGILVPSAQAHFTCGFDPVVNGNSLLLTWTHVNASLYPLYITAQLIDRSADGTTANGFRVNLTSRCCAFDSYINSSSIVKQGIKIMRHDTERLGLIIIC
jgi:hypothetical protein